MAIAATNALTTRTALKGGVKSLNRLALETRNSAMAAALTARLTTTIAAAVVSGAPLGRSVSKGNARHYRQPVPRTRQSVQVAVLMQKLMTRTVVRATTSVTMEKSATMESA